jgi:hypothetical protein
VPIINGTALPAVPVSSSNTDFPLTISLPDESNSVRVEWTPPPVSGKSVPKVSTPTIRIVRDTTGPQLDTVYHIKLPSGESTLILKFKEADIDTAVAKTDFVITRQKANGQFDDGVKMDISRAMATNGRTVALTTGNLPAGTYRLTVNSAFTDNVGNVAGQSGTENTPQQKTFSVDAKRSYGKHVEFPQYTPPAKTEVPASGFNPADYVTTRVSRLYYYRDAHRVAQILNRNIRSYNRAAVTAAQQRAEEARVTANEKVDARRAAERAAVRAAQQSRTAEQNLANGREVLGLAREMNQQIEDNTARIGEINGTLGNVRAAEATADTEEGKAATADNVFENANNMAVAARDTARQAKALADAADPNTPAGKQLIAEATKEDGIANGRKAEAATKKDLAEKARDKADTARAAAKELAARVEKDKIQAELGQLTDQVARHTTDLAHIGGVDAIEKNVNQMQTNVAHLRQTEIAAQEKTDVAEAEELRSQENKFIEGVNLGKTDPDTYVPGDFHSVDPVTQVSISVIGEGLLHFRGPIKGINKLRIMVNQIDSPVGQIKIGIHTIQINGEKGDKMEQVLGNIEGHIDLGRFLTNQSLNLLRRAIQTEAALIAAQSDIRGHYQVDRDRRYVYNFFGRDFIDELYAMDSEFLHTENKLLSLHSMDTSSLNRALLILALAKNDVRQRILDRFLAFGKNELAEAEFDFRRSSELRPHRTQKKIPPWNLTHLPIWNKRHREVTIHEAVLRNANQRYHFRNIRGFFDGPLCSHPDIMNPTQRHFIRMAQIFKARLIAELELQQRIIERGLIEDPSNDDEAQARALKTVHDDALKLVASAYRGLVDAGKKNLESRQLVAKTSVGIRQMQASLDALKPIRALVKSSSEKLLDEMLNSGVSKEEDIKKWFMDNSGVAARYSATLKKAIELIEMQVRLYEQASGSKWITNKQKDSLTAEYNKIVEYRKKSKESAMTTLARREDVELVAISLEGILISQKEVWTKIGRELAEFSKLSVNPYTKWSLVEESYGELVAAFESIEDAPSAVTLLNEIEAAYNSADENRSVEDRIRAAKYIARRTRLSLNQRKILDHLIDKQEDKFIDLVEGSRAHIAVIDNYLKRLAIAIEDDLKVQFYDPAFVRIRDAARSDEVTLGAVERTTILTNNRAFAKVDPSATIEFNLPPRQIAVLEMLNATKALMQDAGAVMNDPTFIAGFKMLGGGQMPSRMQTVVPGLPSSSNQATMGLVPPPSQQGQSALEQLIPPPAIYKLETGTGFEIRPVIGPDGDSVIYDFNYMYTTNIREPVRADEKHLGRIKRHFVHTQVQTSSFELREISRYQVALKVARTGKGVPGLEDLPGVGSLFKPAPSAESSIQQNVILGQTTVYPTLFDLMGLRWAPHVADLDHAGLLDADHITRGRQMVVDHFIQDEAAERFDDMLGIQDKHLEHYRPDLHHRRRAPSPKHPGGYDYDGQYKHFDGRTRGRRLPDPTGNEYERTDPRPEEMQQPAYDRYRHRPVRPERVGPAAPHNRNGARNSRQPVERAADPRRLRLGTPSGDSVGAHRNAPMRSTGNVLRAQNIEPSYRDRSRQARSHVSNQSREPMRASRAGGRVWQSSLPYRTEQTRRTVERLPRL